MDINSEGSTGLPPETLGGADVGKTLILPEKVTPSVTEQPNGSIIPSDASGQVTTTHRDTTMNKQNASVTPRLLPNDSLVVQETSRVLGLPSETVLLDQSSYFPAGIPHGASSTPLASPVSSPYVPSPIQSVSSSSHSLINPGAGTCPVGDGNTSHAQLFKPRAAPSLSTQPVNASRTPSTPRINSSASAPAFSRLSTAHNRQEAPKYPEQSFVALQSSYHSPQSHPLRTRSSHPSPNSFSTTGLSRTTYEHSSMSSGSRTVGNTPAQSPGIFPADNSRNDTSGESDESRYSVPLPSTHLQAPKETHTLKKDIDPDSGRKRINYYEIERRLGSGAHGTVKLGINTQTKEQVAIKIVRRFSKKVRLGKQESPEDKVKKEVAVLKKARHPHVVSLLEVIDDPDFGKVYLILEYVELGEIIWRKRSNKDIAQFEHDRVIREMVGNIDKESEARLLAQFNDDRKFRTARDVTEESEQLLEVQRRLRDRKGPNEVTSESTTTAPNLRTVERVNDSELGKKDGREAQSQARAAYEAVSSGTSSYLPLTPDTEMQEIGTDTKLSSGTTLSSPSGRDQTETSWPAENLEGRMHAPYIADEATTKQDDRNYQDILDQVLAEHTSWEEEDEEFQYVPCLTLTQAREAFRDTVLGLEYLHYQGIIHRDIKPANLLWTKDYRVKISDFGVSYLGKPIREDDNHEEIEEADAANLDEAIELAKTVGTPAFYAPELCDLDLFDPDKNPHRPQITGQIDVWALGVTLYGMIYGRLPFYDVNEFDMYKKIAKEDVFIPKKRLRGVETNTTAATTKHKRPDFELYYEDVDGKLQDLLRRLLQKQPNKRISLKDVKRHDWVTHGIKDKQAWITETDPSLQSQGKKIEVSTQEVNDAVAPLTIVDRIKSSIKRLSSVVGRGRDSRRRAESTAGASEGSSPGDPARVRTGERDGRRSSLRGDEQIFTALRASREPAEHRLAHSLVPSPTINETHIYFPNMSSNTADPPPSASSTKFSSRRPRPPERTASIAESIKTIRAPVSASQVRESSPPAPSASILMPNSTPIVETNTSSRLSGNFSGVLIRNRERGHGVSSASASQSSRASSVDNLMSGVQDLHASPSLAVSSAFAAGEVNQPPVLLEEYSAGSNTQDSSVHYFDYSRGSPAMSFRRDDEQNIQRGVHDFENDDTDIYASNIPDTADGNSYSPSHQSFCTEQTSLPAQNLVAVSSSDDQMTSGISESFSHFSIPSVVSSLSATTDEHQDHLSSQPTLLAGSDRGTNNQSYTRDVLISHGLAAPDDDEAGYNGDGDGDEEEDESDDEGIIMR